MGSACLTSFACPAPTDAVGQRSAVQVAAAVPPSPCTPQSLGRMLQSQCPVYSQLKATYPATRDMRLAVRVIILDANQKFIHAVKLVN